MIGILSLQGDFAEHADILYSIGCEAREVRLKSDLDACSALIIPGGESTVILKQLVESGLDKEIIARAKAGMPIYGTCAGAILLCKQVIAREGREQQSLGLIDIDVARNAYGRQVDSFETELSVPALGEQPLRSIFIRAPIISRVGAGVAILATEKEHPVLVRQGNILVSTFHPELTKDTRVHEYFVKMVGN